MSDIIALKPCKYCGEVPFIQQTGKDRYIVYCTLYACNRIKYPVCHTLKDLEKAWNEMN